MIRVRLAPTLAIAQQVIAELPQNTIFSTVGAEYGDMVVEGNYRTFAYRAKQHQGEPSPCIRFSTPPQSDGLILVSNLNLSTIGGVLILMGKQHMNRDFWKTVAWLDLVGHHHLGEVAEEFQGKLQGFWYWAYSLYTDPTIEADITAFIERARNTLTLLLTYEKSHLELEGVQFYKQQSQEIEKQLWFENVYVRVFLSCGGFCNSAYFSPGLNKIVPVIVTYNMHDGMITLSCENGVFDCAEYMKMLLGPEVEGQYDLAKSPKGKKMDLENLHSVVFGIPQMLLIPKKMV